MLGLGDPNKSYANQKPPKSGQSNSKVLYNLPPLLVSGTHDIDNCAVVKHSLHRCTETRVYCLHMLNRYTDHNKARKKTESQEKNWVSWTEYLKMVESMGTQISCSSPPRPCARQPAAKPAPNQPRSGGEKPGHQ
jgi:hypothetical protein